MITVCDNYCPSPSAMCGVYQFIFPLCILLEPFHWGRTRRNYGNDPGCNHYIPEPYINKFVIQIYLLI